MGSASALVIGPGVEAQLAPDEASDEDSGDFYCSWYEIGPRRYESWTDWSEALKLKPGGQGEAKYLQGDEPPGLANSAKKGTFDFDGMRREIDVGAGAVWDFARKHGLPGTHEERSSPWTAERKAAFSKQMGAFLEAAFPDLYRDKLAYARFVDRELLHHFRERYIECLSNFRVGHWTLIVDGHLDEPDTRPEIASIADPLTLRDAWFQYAYGR
jgi:hypothetical protein